MLQNVEQLQVISGETGAGAVNTTKYINRLSSLSSQLREASSGFTLPEKGGAAAEDSDSEESSPESDAAKAEEGNPDVKDATVGGKAGTGAELLEKEGTA